MSNGNCSTQLLCKIAQVSKSGYYKWLKRQESPTEKQLADEEIKKKIMECYEKLKGIYGYRRVQTWLKKTYGLHMNHKRVQRLMGDGDPGSNSKEETILREKGSVRCFRQPS